MGKSCQDSHFNRLLTFIDGFYLNNFANGLEQIKYANIHFELAILSKDVIEAASWLSNKLLKVVIKLELQIALKN